MKRQSPHGHKTLSRPAVKIVRQLLTLSGSYLPLSKFGLEHPKLKQSGEQEEPLFMALIVKENLPLSTHRRPYLRFSEEARGPSGQSQLQPAQMRIDCTGIRLFFRPRNKRIGAEPREEVAPQTSTLSSIRRLNPVQRQEFIHGSSIDECQSVQAMNAG